MDQGQPADYFGRNIFDVAREERWAMMLKEGEEHAELVESAGGPEAWLCKLFPPMRLTGIEVEYLEPGEFEIRNG